MSIPIQRGSSDYPSASLQQIGAAGGLQRSGQSAKVGVAPMSMSRVKAEMKAAQPISDKSGITLWKCIKGIVAVPLCIFGFACGLCMLGCFGYMPLMGTYKETLRMPIIFAKDTWDAIM